jgi:hypothetical protein
MKRGTRLRRMIVVLALGVAIGTMIMATPATAHFRSSIDHIWSHIKPKADARYINVKGNERGVAVAGLVMNADGTVAGYFNRYGGAPVVLHTADTGRYTIGFPGKTFTYGNSIISMTPNSGPIDGTAVTAGHISSPPYSLDVNTFNAADNTAEDRTFQLLVFLASPSG